MCVVSHGAVTTLSASSMNPFLFTDDTKCRLRFEGTSSKISIHGDLLSRAEKSHHKSFWTKKKNKREIILWQSNSRQILTKKCVAFMGHNQNDMYFFCKRNANTHTMASFCQRCNEWHHSRSLQTESIKNITRCLVENSMFKAKCNDAIVPYGIMLMSELWAEIQHNLTVQYGMRMFITMFLYPPTDIITLHGGHWCIILFSGEQIRRKEGSHGSRKSIHSSCLHFSLKQYSVRSITTHTFLVASCFTIILQTCNFIAYLIM